MSLNKYVTNDGDTLDMIAFRVYGDSRHFIDIILANYGLADQPEVLPAGIVINLPDDVNKTASNVVQLWD